jgi:hypothetical protein
VQGSPNHRVLPSQQESLDLDGKTLGISEFWKLLVSTRKLSWWTGHQRPEEVVCCTGSDGWSPGCTPAHSVEPKVSQCHSIIFPYIIWCGLTVIVLASDICPFFVICCRDVFQETRFRPDKPGLMSLKRTLQSDSWNCGVLAAQVRQLLQMNHGSAGRCHVLHSVCYFLMLPVCDQDHDELSRWRWQAKIDASSVWHRHWTRRVEAAEVHRIVDLAAWGRDTHVLLRLWWAVP